MGEDFFKYLPSEIVVNILSRLPTRTAMACKCVCKPWLALLTTPEFVNFHISRSVPGIVVKTHSRSYYVIEFVDEVGLNFDEKHRWNVAFSFKLPFPKLISSANGLIFLGDVNYGNLILCNPVTRDFIKLPCPLRKPSINQNYMQTFGFGVSRMTGQYKVVGIFFESPLPEECKNECLVYTVGTGLWRKVPFGSPLRLCECEDIEGVHLNGNLHWMSEESKEGLGGWISCFDLETELFSTFSAPPPLDISVHLERRLSVLRDCLCTSDISVDGCVIWLMNEDDKCWTKEFVIPKVDRLNDGIFAWPIRIFENGDVLMEWGDGKLFYYSNKTKNLDYDITAQVVDPSSPATIYASSFLSLKSFVMENVSSFLSYVCSEHSFI